MNQNLEEVQLFRFIGISGNDPEWITPLPPTPEIISFLSSWLYTYWVGEILAGKPGLVGVSISGGSGEEERLKMELKKIPNLSPGCSNVL